MANSVDTFKLYVQSLDATQTPPKPKRSEPISVPTDVDAFDTSYVDKVIFRTGGGGDEDFPAALEEEEEDVFALDPAFASFKSDVSEVAEIDSGLQSPLENAAGGGGGGIAGTSLRPGRPDFLKLSSFMIWNDPDAPNSTGSAGAGGTGGRVSASVSPSASSNQLVNPNQEVQHSQQQQNLRLPSAHKSTFGQLAVSPTESPLSSPEPPQHPSAQAGNLTSSATSKANNMRRRGLFSWNSNAALQHSATGGGGGLHGEPTQLEVNLSGSSLEKSPKSPTAANGGGNIGGSVVSLSGGGGGGGQSSSGGGGPQLGTQLEDEDRFNGDGVQFQGKLIGSEYVAEARGEQMCQQSLKKLKIIQKAMGGHKRRIHLYISFDGIKIADALSAEQLFHHSVPQISFISRDETDTRAFGYVFGNSTTGHQFIGIKTKKEAMVVMTTIGQLFSITLKRKRSAEEAAALAIAESIKEDYKEYYKAAVAAGGVGVGGEGSAEEHIYHTMYGGDFAKNAGGGASTRNRSRTTSQNSSSAEVIIPALLPPPTAADFAAGGGVGHHNHHHHASSAALGSSSTASSRPRSHASTSSSLQPPPAAGSAVVKLAPPPGQQQNLQNSSNSAALNSSAGAEVPVFSSYMPYMPSGGANLGVAGMGSGNQATTDWANFDDDVHFGGGNSGLAQNNNSVMDDSTLNTISSLSSEVGASQFGSAGAGASSSASRTLSNDLAGGGGSSDLTSTSATLVGPRSGQQQLPQHHPTQQMVVNLAGSKNHPRNGSSSTIASGTFDGADPFSDAFGLGDDPFSGSMAVGGGAGGGLSGELSGSGGSLSNVKSHDALSSQFAGMNLERSSANLSGSLNLSKSVDSTSSADRYAALADIHNLSNSIFDSFGNKKSDVRSGNENPTTKSGALFASSQSASIPAAVASSASSLFASQGGQFTVSAFQPQQPQQQQPMYGQPMSVAYQTPNGTFITTTTAAAPIMMGGGTSQQFYQQPQMQFMAGSSAGYVMASPAGSAMMTTTAPNFYPQQQQQQQMMTRNASAPMMQGSASVFSTPPPPSSNSFNVGGSTNSINSMPLFEDLDILGKKKSGGGAFGMKSEPMFQQPSLDSFTRNQMATTATGNYSSTTNPFM